MTTPGGIPNLPVGALTLETLQSKLQDMSGGAMRSRAGERFPAIMGGSSGGTPLSDFTPFGILTRIFSEFNSAVANADPADINGPDDLPELLLSFIENLPVVGEFVGLLEAILGTYDGDDEVLLQIQQLFRFLRADGLIDASKLFGELPEAVISTVVDVVVELVRRLLNALGIPIQGTLLDQIMDLADGLADWQADTDSTAAGLDDLLGGLLTHPDQLLGGALGLLLPKSDWSKLLTQFTAAGNNGTAPSTGIPALDNMISSFLGVRSTANGANSTALNAASTASSAQSAANNAASTASTAQALASAAQSAATSVQSQAVTTRAVDGLTVVYTTITGTGTWNRSAIPSGCTTRVKTGVTICASGQGGTKPARITKVATNTSNGTTTFYAGYGGPGGLGGEVIYAEFDPATVGASQTATIGLGGAGATTAGNAGALGGTTSFGSLLSLASGAGGGVALSVGVTALGNAGNGGQGGTVDGTASSSTSYFTLSALVGGNAYGVAGGAAGSAGSSGTAGGTGNNAPTGDNILTGASGGGGGGAGNNTLGTGGAGGNGGNPGGGGGGGGGSIGTGGNGGTGGRGEILVAEYFK